jgi:uncharacterized protein YjbI with pentapeptide repeats
MKDQELHEKYKSGERNFQQVDFKGVNLAWATFSDADFEGANLEGANFKSATLHRVNFQGANLSFADLSGAELVDTNLSSANLVGANLSDAQLNSIIDEKTQLPRGIQAKIYTGDFSKKINELYDKLGKENQKAQLAFTQLNEKNAELEKNLQNEREQVLLERKQAKFLAEEYRQLELTIKLTTDNFFKEINELNESLEKEHQQSKFILTQLQQRNQDLENAQQQAQELQKRIPILLDESEHLRRRQVEIETVLTDRNNQFTQLTQENIKIHKQLKNEQQQSQLIITQKEHELESAHQNVEELQKLDRQTIQMLLLQGENLRLKQIEDEIILAAQNNQIQELTLDNFNLQELLKNDQQQTQPIITQLQQKEHDLENAQLNAEERQKLDQQTINVLSTENEQLRHIKIELETILAEQSNKTEIIENRESNYISVLQGINLEKAGLSSCDFSKVNLNYANFKKANLEKSNFSESSLKQADFRESNLEHAVLKMADLTKADLTKAKLKEANLEKANLQFSDFTEANLEKANLEKAKLDYAILNYSNLERANLRGVTLQMSQLERANIKDGDLREANLYQANLQHANLSGADLRNANLEGVNLENANLEKANLEGSNLKNAELNGANLKDVIGYNLNVKIISFTNNQDWKNNVLQKAHSLSELSRLIKLLEREDWKKADEETCQVILQFSSLSNQQVSELDQFSIQNFPVAVLQIIDQLWMHYSLEHFGFTAQADVWKEYGNIETKANLQKMGDCLGWRQDGRWLWYKKMRFSLNAPKGHLPARIYDKWNGEGVVFHSSWISNLH